MRVYVYIREYTGYRKMFISTFGDRLTHYVGCSEIFDRRRFADYSASYIRIKLVVAELILNPEKDRKTAESNKSILNIVLN